MGKSIERKCVVVWKGIYDTIFRAVAVSSDGVTDYCYVIEYEAEDALGNKKWDKPPAHITDKELFNSLLDSLRKNTASLPLNLRSEETK